MKYSKDMVFCVFDVQVYSANSDVAHSPPEQLLMKNQQWPTGDKIRTVLTNANDEV